MKVIQVMCSIHKTIISKVKAAQCDECKWVKAQAQLKLKYSTLFRKRPSDKQLFLLLSYTIKQRHLPFGGWGWDLFNLFFHQRPLYTTCASLKRQQSSKTISPTTTNHRFRRLLTINLCFSRKLHHKSNSLYYWFCLAV